MANLLIAPQGTRLVTLTAGQSIALYSATETQVFEVVGFPNYPLQLDSEATFTGYQNLGPYASGATLQINAGAAQVEYNVGTAPVVSGVPRQIAPVARNAAIQLTAADCLVNNIVTNTHATGATVALDLPNGAALDAATNLAVDEYFDWVILNLSTAAGDTVTLQVGVATTHTLVGSGVVAINASQRFRTRKTAANTFISYRV
jgi:hypothetical protein